MYTRRISLQNPEDANIPLGGTAGQALVKGSSVDRDVEWASIGAFHIGVTSETESGTTTYTCDQKAADIYDAYKAGRVLYFDVEGETIGDDDENVTSYFVDRANFAVTDGVLSCSLGASSYITDWANEAGIFTAAAGTDYPTATVTE